MIKREYLLIGVIVLIGICVAIGITAACKAAVDTGFQTNSADPNSPTPRYLIYSEWDNGATSLVHHGDVIVIRLPENPTTEYQWDITRSNGLRILDDSYIYPDPSGRMTGTGGWRRVTLMPEALGTESVSAVHKRSWEDDNGDEQHFSIQFEVR